MDDRAAEGDGERRARRRLIAWMLAVAGLLVVAVAFGVWKRFERARETIASHKARIAGERAALASRRRGRPALVEPAGMGEAGAVARAFFAALEAVPEAEREKVVDLTPKVAPPQAEIEAVLAAHPEVLAALEALPSVPAIGPSATDSDVALEGYMWLAASADAALRRGDPKTAARIDGLLATWGCDMAREQPYDVTDFGMSLEVMGSFRLLSAVAVGIEADEARRAGAVLDGVEANRVDSSLVFDGARASFRLQVASPIFDSLRSHAQHPGFRHLWSKKIFTAEALEDLDELVDALAAASAGSERDARAAIARVKAASPVVHPLLDNVPHWFTSWIEKRETVRAWGLVARTACAVSEATARRGALPKTLDELVPEFLPAVPIDPWSGKPLRYEDGRVWSLGPNGIDDGGTPVDLSGGKPLDLAARVPAPR